MFSWASATARGLMSTSTTRACGATAAATIPIAP